MLLLLIPIQVLSRYHQMCIPFALTIMYEEMS
jgi:hypothetical protein